MTQEPIRVTVTRTVGIALVGGLAIATLWRGFGSWTTRWAVVSVLLLWPSFGGHWLELWFLNWLRPRLPDRRQVQTVARLAVWFVGGIAFAFAVWLTATALAGGRPVTPLPWWVAGIAFIGVELVAHLGLQLRGRPSFFNGRE